MKPKHTLIDGGIKLWKNSNDQWHREDGPALEYANGDKYWFLNGKLHREDGPAMVHIDGDKRWYLNHERYSLEEWIKKIMELKKMSKEEVIAKFVMPHLL